MKPHFTKKFFVGNRERLRSESSGALIVVTANGLLQRGADSAHKFSQDANFWYLTGIDEPDVLLVINGEDEYLVLPELSDYQKIFDGSSVAGELAQRSGVKKVYGNREGWKRLGSQIKSAKSVATVAVPPAYVELYGMYTNPARASLIDRLKKSASRLRLDDLTPQLIRQRMIKQPEEIAAIQSAIDITTASLKDTFSRKYDYEYEVEAAITAGFRRRGASGHAFEPIVAAGKRACTLHNVGNDAPIRKDELVVVDVGAEVEHYAADITRTVSFGKPSTRQRAIHAAVREAQDYAIGLLKPGIAFKDYRDQTDRFIGDKLRGLGLIKTKDDKAIRDYYPHAISHFLGLNVHDAGNYGQLLEPGMVITVEPGIYVPKESIGVRIEDDVLITDNGCMVLSQNLPRGLG